MLDQLRIAIIDMMETEEPSRVKVELIADAIVAGMEDSSMYNLSRLQIISGIGNMLSSYATNEFNRLR